MASHSFFFFCLYSYLMLLAFSTLASSTLSPNYYDHSCPKALPTIKKAVQAAITKERRMGASLLRLHFHDCMVNGCDGSVLLDPSSEHDSEKVNVTVNLSLRGFDVVDQIKRKVDMACGHPVVSCADILAVAARDSVVALGGPTWSVRLGRRDSAKASSEAANKNLPNPFMDLPALIQNFQNQGLDERDLVVLSGGHTVGFAFCAVFKNRIHNETDHINPTFAARRRQTCPANGGDLNVGPLDSSPGRFDSTYFNDLLNYRGLLHSDQALFSGGSTDALVKTYQRNFRAFATDFATSMVKMGNIKPLTGEQGQVRLNCRKAN